MNAEKAKVIGARLKQLRGNKTIAEIAPKLGISNSALAMYEQGRRIPRDETKIAIAAFYGVSVQELFFSTR